MFLIANKVRRFSRLFGVWFLLAGAALGQTTYVLMQPITFQRDVVFFEQCPITPLPGAAMTANVNVVFSYMCPDGWGAAVAGNVEFPTTITVGVPASVTANQTATFSNGPGGTEASILVFATARGADPRNGDLVSSCTGVGPPSTDSSAAQTNCMLTFDGQPSITVELKSGIGGVGTRSCQAMARSLLGAAHSEGGGRGKEVVMPVSKPAYPCSYDP